MDRPRELRRAIAEAEATMRGVMRDNGPEPEEWDWCACRRFDLAAEDAKAARASLLARHRRHLAKTIASLTDILESPPDKEEPRPSLMRKAESELRQSDDHKEAFATNASSSIAP